MFDSEECSCQIRDSQVASMIGQARQVHDNARIGQTLDVRVQDRLSLATALISYETSSAPDHAIIGFQDSRIHDMVFAGQPSYHCASAGACLPRTDRYVLDPGRRYWCHECPRYGPTASLQDPHGRLAEIVSLRCPWAFRRGSCHCRTEQYQQVVGDQGQPAASVGPSVFLVGRLGSSARYLLNWKRTPQHIPLLRRQVALTRLLPPSPGELGDFR